MRHRKDYKKLGRSSSHKKAMLSTMVCSLVLKKRIVTTVTKAKEVRRVAEKMVTIARQGTLQARRNILAFLQKPNVVKVLMEEIAPQFKERSGGYTRIIKLGRYRIGDGAELAFLEWVGITIPQRKKRKKKETATTGKA